MGQAELIQTPQPGTYHIYREGDFLDITLRVPSHWQGRAYLRTSLFAPKHKLREIIDYTEQGSPRRFQEWGDFQMQREGSDTFVISVPLVSVGFFEAKAFFLPEGEYEPVWPGGDNLFVKIEPADSVISNSIYSAFVRLFIGEQAISHIRRELGQLGDVKNKDYALIPDSGKFRDLAQQVDFIVDTLGFDIIMLLPVHPTPTTYARMGLFGSPYAALDFMNVDPALAEFDKLTTPMEQFGELIDAVHAKHARIFMDIPVNHTGWASQLQVHHPEYFVKSSSGKFVSPGAWGVTWSDLAKLDYDQPGLWRYMAEVFLFWCSKGVDGFRCDAGYMIPPEAWLYITARVKREYPSTIFLLEGLGGKVSTTEKLLTECNLDWAYSEMFQNYDQGQMEWYIDEYARTTFSKGPLVNFSETHDNNRLAAVSHDFSRLRNALTALLSDTGTFGMSCGVEWFAHEKIDVHRLTSMNWGNPDNQISWIRKLNNIIKTHPAFQAGSSLEKIHTSHTNSIAYKRYSPDKKHTLIILANLNDQPNELFVDIRYSREMYENSQDLLSGEDLVWKNWGNEFRIQLKPHQVAAVCSDPSYHRQVVDQRVDAFIRKTKSERLLKLQVMKLFLSDGYELSEQWVEERTGEFEADPYGFFFAHFTRRPPVVQWSHPRDVRRMVIVPSGTPVMVMAGHYFRFRIRNTAKVIEHGEGFYLREGQYVSIIPPGVFDTPNHRYYLEIEVYDGESVRRDTGHLMVASAGMFDLQETFHRDAIRKDPALCALSVNEGGGVSIARGAFSALQSKYDGLIAANLNPGHPEDRYIMLTRLRGWAVCKGFSRALGPEYQHRFVHRDNTTQYYFEMPAGGGLFIPLWLTMDYDHSADHLRLVVKREASANASTPADDVPVKVILRPDMESRNHHHLTKAFTGPEQDWPNRIQEHSGGFVFDREDKKLRVELAPGQFVREDEWQYMVNRPLEVERGMDGNGDLYSPGYFRVDLTGGQQAVMEAVVETEAMEPAHSPSETTQTADVSTSDDGKDIAGLLARGIRQFMVRRNSNQTVIAGFPWFLDWGRDTLICLRGLIAAGYDQAAENILAGFASFEDRGTLPNVLHGADISNRDTSDAPLWFIAAVRALYRKKGKPLLDKDVGGRTLHQVITSIILHYQEGTPNGIQMDPESGLIYSPTHFTWMDTNYPAGTPRQGYPVEIQALWHHALVFLSELEQPPQQWEALARKVQQSMVQYFKMPNPDTLSAGGYFLSDCLHAQSFVPAHQATPDDHIRPNQLFAITLGAIDDPDLMAGIVAVAEELVIPGAIRSLADRPVQYPLAVHHRGQLLNNPHHPYQGHYSGDEDWQRKPAYHNGTAWTWPLPSYCEALWITYGHQARQRGADILSASIQTFNHGCIGHLPELLDGNYSHHQKGCFAQAWGITEFFRVARLLGLFPEDYPA